MLILIFKVGMIRIRIRCSCEKVNYCLGGCAFCGKFIKQMLYSSSTELKPANHLVVFFFIRLHLYIVRPVLRVLISVCGSRSFFSSVFKILFFVCSFLQYRINRIASRSRFEKLRTLIRISTALKTLIYAAVGLYDTHSLNGFLYYSSYVQK